MLDKPEIVQTEKQLAAVIRLTIPRKAIQSAIGAGHWRSHGRGRRIARA